MKKNTGVKVKVDYYKGTYTVTGMYNNKILSVRKPITGVDNDSYFKRNFSLNLIWRRRRQMKRNLKKIQEKYPEYKFSKKLIKNVDPLMYKTLEYWDKMTGTDYASGYLKTMVQAFDENSFAKTSQGTYEEKCINARRKDLKKHGINMSYDVGLFNTSNKLSLLDRIRGIRIAKKQEKLASVEVKKSIFMKKREVSLDIEALRKAKVKTARKQQETPKKEGRWTRKIRSEKDSIRNKKFIHKDGVKSVLVKSVIPLLSVATMFNAGMIHHLRPSYDIPVTEQATNSDKNYSKTNDNSNLYSKFDSFEKTQNITNSNRNYSKIDEDSESNENYWFFDNSELDSQDDSNKLEKKITEITFEVEEDKQSKKNLNKGITFEVENDEEAKVSSNKENTSKDTFAEKSDEEKVEEFRKIATQKCMDAFIIGEKPKVGNMLDDQYYSENMNGSGNIGYFSTHPDSITGRIIVVKEDGKSETIDTKGMTLSDVLDAFPKYKDYYIQFARPSESGSLKSSDYRGFIKRDKLERLIQSQVDSIIESKTSPNLELSSDDEAR